jgi:transcriptional antiterminator NusG
MHTFVLFSDTAHIHPLLHQLDAEILTGEEQVYTPLIERIKRIRGMDQKVYIQMFPGYLFVDTNDPDGLTDRIHKNRNKTLFWYCRMLRGDEYALPISDEEQRWVKKFTGEGHVFASSTGILKAKRLTVISGPLKDFTGDVVKINRHKNTATIRLPFMGQLTDVVVGLEVVRVEE